MVAERAPDGCSATVRSHYRVTTRTAPYTTKTSASSLFREAGWDGLPPDCTERTLATLLHHSPLVVARFPEDSMKNVKRRLIVAGMTAVSVGLWLQITVKTSPAQTADAALM